MQICGRPESFSITDTDLGFAGINFYHRNRFVIISVSMVPLITGRQGKEAPKPKKVLTLSDRTTRTDGRHLKAPDGSQLCLSWTSTARRHMSEWWDHLERPTTCARGLRPEPRKR